MDATSQLAQNLHTVLGQMADLDRAKRIKGLREGTVERAKPWPSPRYIKQRVLIEGIEELTGGHFVTLRGLQEWEKTGGIVYEKCTLIAQYFGVDPDWLYYGPERQTETPDLGAVLNGKQAEDAVEVLARLASIETKLDLLLGTTPLEEPPPDATDVPVDPQLDQDSPQEGRGEAEPGTQEEGR